VLYAFAFASRKLTRSWNGPWRVIEFETTIVVVAQTVKTNKKQAVHVDHLVLCHSRLHGEAEETPFLRRLVHVAAPVNLQGYGTTT